MTCGKCNHKVLIPQPNYCPKCGAYLPFDVQEIPESLTDPYALTGFILSCFSLCVDFLGILTILALVLSAKGLKQIKVTGEGGKALAIFGIMISVLSIFLKVAVLIYLLTLGRSLILPYLV